MDARKSSCSRAAIGGKSDECKMWAEIYFFCEIEAENSFCSFAMEISFTEFINRSAVLSSGWLLYNLLESNDEWLMMIPVIWNTWSFKRACNSLRRRRRDANEGSFWNETALTFYELQSFSSQSWSVPSDAIKRYNLCKKVIQLTRMKPDTGREKPNQIFSIVFLWHFCALRFLFAISSNLFFYYFCDIFSVEFHLPKSQKKEAKKCYFSFATSYFFIFLCALLQISFKTQQKATERRKKKQQFYNLGGPGYMCAAKKVQRTISRLFEYEKNRII